MAPIRLRHPKGVATLQLDTETATVQDLLQAIFEASEIPPSSQDLKVGYPPKPLTAVIPELPLSSLGIASGDQLIVTQKPGTAPSPTTSAPRPAPASQPSAASRSKPRDALPFSFGEASTPAPPVKSTGPDQVRTEGGFLVHRVVPDDNSCLFSSVALVFEQDMRKASTIRQVVADAIRKDPETWNEAILGRPREDYIKTILSPNSWGGAIELSILAAHYSTEIASIDVETGRIDHFTPSVGPPPTNRVLLIYSGIHYDAAVIAPTADAPAEWCASIVPVAGNDVEDPTMRALGQLATLLRKKRAYTNTATFDLKCEICAKGLKGEKEARAHAEETGHTKFGEY
ncbi:OTU-domain-containing protein [Artomyces pyxidatus]|uniref:OTU-domain-containing protein n=1 Tax=Artomyces pyxidatus TaxID=48021 RepID=A0ACB8T7G6_9AGAM|nr:OTU-domain-containing protein [Artomyces pyxidatus]